MLTGIALPLVLVACGGSAPQEVSNVSGPALLQTVAAPGTVPIASGPIRSACRAAGRGNNSGKRCGCVQAAANMTLSPEEQRRGAGYFRNPETLQEMKLSDTPRNERRWESWARFAETAETLCRSA